MKTSAIVLVALLGYSAKAAPSLKQKLSNNLVEGFGSMTGSSCNNTCDFTGPFPDLYLGYPAANVDWCDCYAELVGGNGQFNQSQFATAVGVS